MMPLQSVTVCSTDGFTRFTKKLATVRLLQSHSETRTVNMGALYTAHKIPLYIKLLQCNITNPKRIFIT